LHLLFIYIRVTTVKCNKGQKMFLHIGHKPPTYGDIISALEKDRWLRLSEIYITLEILGLSEDKLRSRLHKLTLARIIKRRRSDTHFVDVPPALGHRGGKVGEFEFKLPIR